MSKGCDWWKINNGKGNGLESTTANPMLTSSTTVQEHCLFATIYATSGGNELSYQVQFTNSFNILTLIQTKQVLIQNTQN